MYSNITGKDMKVGRFPTVVHRKLTLRDIDICALTFIVTVPLSLWGSRKEAKLENGG